MISVCGNDAGAPRIDMTLLLLPEAGLRNPEIRTSASDRAPRAVPSAARIRAATGGDDRDRRLDCGHIVDGAAKVSRRIGDQDREPAGRTGLSRANQLITHETVEIAVIAGPDRAIAARQQDHAGARRRFRLDQHRARAADAHRLVGKCGGTDECGEQCGQTETIDPETPRHLVFP